MNDPRLVCFGNLTLDDVVLPDGRERLGCIGGDALYAALAARLFEPLVEMVAPVGVDFPAEVSRRIAAAGFSRDGLAARPLPTLRSRVVYDAEGGRTWHNAFADAAFDALSPEPGDVPAHHRNAAGFLVLAMSLDGQERIVADVRRARRAVVALDPQEDYIAGNAGRLRGLIARTDVFMPSAEEVRRLLGHEDWAAAARQFAAWGPGLVVVKLGPEGALAYARDADAFFQCRPPPAARAVDPTGAGDSFCGAFLAQLLRHPGAIEDALRAATAAASIAIADFGVERLFTGRPETAEALARAVDVSRVDA